MIQLLIYFFIALTLSIDAFSLALSIGIYFSKKKEGYLFSLTVGLMHFILPIIGCYFGNKISNYMRIKPNIISCIIFLLLAIQIYRNKDEKEQIKNVKVFEILLLSLSVSMDSLSIGVALGINQESILLASTIFMITTFYITTLGINIGKKIQNNYQTISTKIGIIMLILIALKYLILG